MGKAFVIVQRSHTELMEQKGKMSLKDSSHQYGGPVTHVAKSRVILNIVERCIRLGWYRSLCED